MLMSRDILFLVFVLARLCIGIEDQSDGICELGDDTCLPSPKALIQMKSHISRNLAVVNSAESESTSAISAAEGIGNITSKQPLNDDEYQAVAKKCCWRDMEIFVKNVAKAEGLEFCARGGLMGLLAWFDCTDDKQNYTNLVAAIRKHGPGTNGVYKDDCPFLGKPGCVDFPKNRKCPVITEPLQDCKSTTSTLPPTGTTTEPTTTVATTTTTTSVCSETNWEADVFKRCDFWGDPHWHATFYDRKGKMNFYGNGIFELAKTKDGSFKAQSFQCKVVPKKGKEDKPKPAVAVALAMSISGRMVFIHNHTVEIDGSLAPPITEDGYIDMSENQCVRWKVRVKNRGKKGKPAWAHAVTLRMNKDIAADAGLCGQGNFPEHDTVPDNEVLFSKVQLAEICKTCTVDTPKICKDLSKSLLQENVSSPETMPPLLQSMWDRVFTASEERSEMVQQKPITENDLKVACSNATPAIDPEQAKMDCAGAFDVKMCVIDYCSTNGDFAMVEAAVEEATLFAPGCKKPDEACSDTQDCCDDMICYNSVCRWPKVSPCIFAKKDTDTCEIRDYATNPANSETRCFNQYWLPDMKAKPPWNGFHEVYNLTECADLCDKRKGCIGFDLKNNDMWSVRSDDRTRKVWRCSLCGAIEEECPTLKPQGQYTHYHRTKTGCPER